MGRLVRTCSQHGFFMRSTGSLQTTVHLQRDQSVSMLRSRSTVLRLLHVSARAAAAAAAAAAILEPPWSHLGAILGHLGAILGHVKSARVDSINAPPKHCSFVHLENILGHHGAILGHLGAILGPSWAISSDLKAKRRYAQKHTTTIRKSRFRGPRRLPR